MVVFELKYFLIYMYHILPYSYDKAKQLNVKISPSDNPKYKIKVCSSNGVFICNIGSSN